MSYIKLIQFCKGRVVEVIVLLINLRNHGHLIIGLRLKDQEDILRHPLDTGNELDLQKHLHKKDEYRHQILQGVTNDVHYHQNHQFIDLVIEILQCLLHHVVDIVAGDQNLIHLHVTVIRVDIPQFLQPGNTNTSINIELNFVYTY